LVALANFMRLSLMKAAHVVASSAAWQEIRVRSGRDDKFVGAIHGYVRLGTSLVSVQQICHLDRSVAQWRDLRFFI
jgi:hypothetical protein